MASVNAEVKVSVEKIVHDGIRDFAQRVAKEYGICLEHCSIDWGYVVVGDPVILEVRIDTSTR